MLDADICDCDADALSALARELQRLGRRTLEGVLDLREAAAAVLCLASDPSRFVTGTRLHVDGGNHAAGG